MYGTIVIHMPLTGTGIPVVDLKKVLHHVMPDLNHAIAEGMVQGQTMIPLNEHLDTKYPRVHAHIHWAYTIHAQTNPRTPTGSS